MYRQIHLCNELRKQYEKEKSGTFDVVIRLRPDYQFGTERLSIPDEFGHDVFVDVLHPNEGVGDQFAMSSGRNMDVYSSVWELALLATDFEGRSYFPRPNGAQPHTFLHDVLWCNGLAPRIVPRSNKTSILPNRPPLKEFGSRLLSELKSCAHLGDEDFRFIAALERSLGNDQQG